MFDDHEIFWKHIMQICLEFKLLFLKTSSATVVQKRQQSVATAAPRYTATSGKCLVYTVNITIISPHFSLIFITADN